MTQFQQGQIPWSKGKTFTPEHREKIRLGNLGKKRSLTTRANMSKARKGVPISDEHKQNIAAAVSAGYSAGTRRVGNTRGELNGMWHGGVSAATKTARQLYMLTTEYKNWRKHVFQRDDYTCQACGDRGVKLEADHELPYALYPDLRLEVLNGRALCVPCHKKTPTYGRTSHT